MSKEIDTGRRSQAQARLAAGVSMTGRRGEAGQALILVAVSSTVLFAFVAMGIDMGYLRYRKVQMQTATDAGALAGASVLQYGGVTAAAKNDTANNGFTDGSNGVSVTVNNPPVSGPHAADAGYVEVIVAQNQRTFFAHALAVTSVPLSARGVAFLGSDKACMYALDPSASQAFWVHGNANVTVHCGIVVDSSSSSGFRANGNVNVNAVGSIGVVGNYAINGGATVTPTPIPGIVPVADPLAYLVQPAVGACNHNNTVITGNQTVTLNPGVYCGGITIHANAKVTLTGGLYILNGGGFTADGGPGGSVTGNGVTIFNTGTAAGPTAYAPITITGTGTYTLSAPATGGLAGILFFQDRNIPSSVTTLQNKVTGGANTIFQGALYFPTTPLVYLGNSSLAALYTIIVARTVEIGGDAGLNDNYQTLPNGISPLKAALLVE